MDGFFIALSIAFAIFVFTSTFVLIRRRRQRIQHTGQVIHYGGPPSNPYNAQSNIPQNAQPNAPPPSSQCNSSLPPNFLTITPQTTEQQQQHCQTSGLPSYQNAVYGQPASTYLGAPTAGTNIIVSPGNSAQYYPDSYQTRAVVVTTTGNVTRY